MILRRKVAYNMSCTLHSSIYYTHASPPHTHIVQVQVCQLSVLSYIQCVHIILCTHTQCQICMYLNLLFRYAAHSRCYNISTLSFTCIHTYHMTYHYIIILFCQCWCNKNEHILALQISKLFHVHTSCHRDF